MPNIFHDVKTITLNHPEVHTLLFVLDNAIESMRRHGASGKEHAAAEAAAALADYIPLRARLGKFRERFTK